MRDRVGGEALLDHAVAQMVGEREEEHRLVEGQVRRRHLAGRGSTAS